MTRFASTAHAECPDPVRLEQLAGGELSAAEQAELTQHLDTCIRCQRVLEALTSVQESWVAAARAQRTTTPAADSAYWRALRKLEQDEADLRETRLPDTVTQELSLDFLEPAADAQYIGRLQDYEVIRIIGQGGMGAVLQAFDRCLQRNVAIKVLAGRVANNSTAYKRFCREARAAAAIRHENVVAIHAVDEIHGRPYLVMEYVPGVSLEQYLEDKGQLELTEILRIAAQTAAGLAAAHEQGLIHRDIKPANILIEQNHQRVKLTDFGLARASDDVKLTQSGTVAGTPLYMAPEQALGETLDPRADLFSLGSVLYAMCTGVTPFEAQTPLAVLRRITEEMPRPVREIRSDVPEWLEEIIERLQAKKRDDRFESAAQVAELLNQYLSHLRQPSRIMMPCSPRVRNRRRRRLFMAGAAVGLIVGVGADEAARVFGLQSLVWPKSAAVQAADATAVPAESPALLETLQGNAGPIWSVAFCPDGQTLAMGSDDGTVKFWDLQMRQVTTTLNAHQGAVWAVAFSRTGNRMATASDDGTAKVWDPITGNLVKPFKHSTAVRTVALSPDGKLLATGSRDGGVRIWDVDKGEEAARTSGHARSVMSVAFSPNGKMLASASGDRLGKLWDVATGQEHVTLHGHTGGVYGVAFSPDGKTVASGSWDKTVILWDAGTGTKLRTLSGHEQDVWSVAFSSDGQMLASASEDHTARIWDVATGRELAVYRGHQGTVYTVKFAPETPMVATAGRDATIRLWSPPTPR
jgi:WD40 repeat protein